MKKESTGPPTRCVGRSMRKVLLCNMDELWHFSSSNHARATAGNAESYVKKNGISFAKS